MWIRSGTFQATRNWQKALSRHQNRPKLPSTLEKYREQVKTYLDQNLQKTVIYQRLREDYGYEGSYSSVRQFVLRLKPVEKEVFVRVNTEPGKEMQVDFGHVGPIVDLKTKRTRNG